jgi:hypothetical protein
MTVGRRVSVWVKQVGRKIEDEETKVEREEYNYN